MQDGEKILQYANRIRQLAATLKNMGVEIDGNEVAMALLNGLPDRFNGLISALDALGNEDKIFTFELVKSRLLQEEQRTDMRMQTSIVKSEAAALVVQNQSDSCSSCKKRPKCEHCGMPGHVIDRCWKKHPHLRKSFGDRRKKQSALMAGTKPVSQDNEDENQYICLMGKVTHCLMGKLENSNIPKGSKSCFIDSGCSNHVTYDRSKFSSYVALPPGGFEMGNKATTEVTGMRNITVELKVDGRRQMCILKDVLHVFDLGYQLLSVLTMDKLELDTSFKHARCRIKTDTKTIASGTLRKGLYHLGLVEISKTPVRAMVVPLQRWYERLAHVDKAGI
jgi:hypothetical protein